MPAPGQTGKRRHSALNMSVRPSVHPFVRQLPNALPQYFEIDFDWSTGRWHEVVNFWGQQVKDRELRYIRPYLDFKTASTIATSIVHSKLDYCNSLYHNLPNCQLNRLQQIQNSFALAVVKAPKSTHITPILKSLHWLKVNERIEYKLLSLLLKKVLTTAQSSYLRNLISLQPPRSTRSSSVVTLSLARQPYPP